MNGSFLIEKSSLVPMSEEYLDIVFQWRNSIRIRESMFNQNEIKLDEHLKWFSKIKSNQINYYFVFLYENNPSGFVSFNSVESEHKRAYWGFYKGDVSLPKIVTLLMGYLALNKAFNEFGFNKVYGEVIPQNEKSKQYHLNLGFQQEGYLTSHVLINRIPEDVILYGINKYRWESTLNEFWLKLNR